MKGAARPIAAALLVAGVVAVIAWRFGFGGELLAPSRVERGAPEEAVLREPPPSPASTEAGADVAATTVRPDLGAARELLVGAPIAITTVDVAGQPLANVAVRLAPSLPGFVDETATLASLTTDASGRASLARDAIGERRGFWLLASHAGFVPTCLCLESQPLLETGELSVVLEERMEMVVEVVDPRGKPVAGADVQWIGPRGLDALDQLGERIELVEGSLYARGRSDADGTVALPMSAKQGGYLEVVAPPLLLVQTKVTQEERAARRKVVQLGEVVIAGWRIVDAGTGHTSRRSRGAAVFFELPTGSFEPLAIGFGNPPLENIESAARARLTVPDVELLVWRRVRDAADAAPLEIRITADPQTAPVKLPLRFVTLDEFGDGEVLLVPSACRDDDLAELTVAFTDPAGQIVAPPRNWSLRAPGLNVTQPPPRDGRFVFVVPPATYELRYWPDVPSRSRNESRSIEVNPGTRQEIVVTIAPALAPPTATLRVRAIDVTGQPLKNWRTFALAANEMVDASEEDPLIRHFDRLPAGRVTLHSFCSGLHSEKLELDLVAGETREVEFTFR